jgi:hypothetical protein
MVTCVTQEKERTKVNVYTLKASSSVLSSPIYTGRKLTLELINPNVSRKYSTAFPLFHSIDGLISKTYTNKKKIQYELGTDMIEY